MLLKIHLTNIQSKSNNTYICGRKIKNTPIPMEKIRNVTLSLEDGTLFHGRSFGYEKAVSGEVVFNTAMSGYPESLTDPSYAGQMMTLTYPLVGNYGVPPFTFGKDGIPEFMESEKIHVRALIVSDYSEKYSHWNGVESLGEWLKREEIPAITGIDTRRLTKVLREHGVMMGKILFDDEPDSDIEMENYGDINFVDRVSCKEVMVYAGGEILRHSCAQDLNNADIETFAGGMKKVVLVDCGVKANILRCLLKRGVAVIRVPWNYDFNNLKFDGLFISNGPGDPDTCDAAAQNIRKPMKNNNLPIFGHNQPVRMAGTNRCFITSQNHGYAVDNTTLPVDWEPLFLNMNDGSNEGIRHKSNPWFSAQFHPEACSGPTDTEFLFDEFVKMI